MQACSANGIDSTAFDPACVNAGPGVALLVDPTVVMNDTLRSSLNCRRDERIIMQNFIIAVYKTLSSALLTKLTEWRHLEMARKD